MAPAKTRPIRVRYRRSLQELLQLAVASVDRPGGKLDLGRFNPLPQGRHLTRVEKIIGLTFATAFGLAVWIHVLPEPVSAHAGHYRSLALTAGSGSETVQTFVESTVLALGREWKAPVLFAHAHEQFWRRDPAVHPNILAARVEAGLASLAGHGPIMRATVFGRPAFGTRERRDGSVVMTGRVTGQVELADGTVVRLDALLIQDGRTKQWGLAELMLPPFLP